MVIHKQDPFMEVKVMVEHIYSCSTRWKSNRNIWWTHYIRTCIGYGTVIAQLRIVILDDEDNLQIYGPYGTELYDGASTFTMYKSMFGYHREYWDGLGVFYVPWGACGSSCN